MTDEITDTRAPAPTALRSKVTVRGQTTLPAGVRQALHLRPGVDAIEYVMEGDRAVIQRAADPVTSEEDTALVRFLDLLEGDVRAHPERLRPFPSDLYARMSALTDGIEVNPDEPIDGPVAL